MFRSIALPANIPHVYIVVATVTGLSQLRGGSYGMELQSFFCANNKQQEVDEQPAVSEQDRLAQRRPLVTRAPAVALVTELARTPALDSPPTANTRIAINICLLQCEAFWRLAQRLCGRNHHTTSLSIGFHLMLFSTLFLLRLLE